MDKEQRKYLSVISEITAQACEEKRHEYDSSVESFEHYKKRMLHKAEQLGKVYLKNSTHAFEIVISELAKAHDKTALEQLFTAMLKAIEVFETKKQEQEEISIASSCGFNEQLLEKIFQIGRTAFLDDQINNAKQVFSLLIMLDPGYTVGWLALGMIFYREKKWQEAAFALNTAALLDEHTPLPHLYVSECYKQLGMKQEAQDALKSALARATAKPQYAEYVGIIKDEQRHL